MNRFTLTRVLFVIAAFISFVFSVYLWFSGHKQQGIFVGIWVPSILAFGVLMLVGKSEN